MSDPLISQTLGGRYQIIKLIASGSSSSVYLANHTLMGTPVAIKVLTKVSPESLRRFQREAKILSNLKHPNIVGIASFGNEGEMVYLVMDLLEGQSLKQLLEKKNLSLEEAVNIALQTCAGLDYAHEQGVLHRDLNASNIMIIQTADSLQVKILDFGLSKVITTEESGQDSSTGSGALAGTPVYMSPEQCRQETLDRRSDIYSFGCLFYEMLCGHPPFVGNTALETMDMQINAELPPLTVTAANQVLPDMLKRIIDRCLKKNPELRYASCREIEDALRGISTASIKFAAYSQVNSIPSRKIPFAIATVLCLALLVPLLLRFLHKREVPPDKNVGTSITDSMDSDWKEGPVGKKSWKSVVKRVDRLNLKHRSEESERLLKEWLAANPADKLSFDCVDMLIYLSANTAEYRADKTLPCRLLLPYLPLLRKNFGAQSQQYYHIVHALLSSAYNIGGVSCIRGPALELKELCKKFDAPFGVEYIRLGLGTAQEYMSSLLYNDAIFVFSIAREALEHQYKQGKILPTDEQLIRYIHHIQQYENACLSQFKMQAAALDACQFRLKLIDRLKQGNLLKAECFYKQAFILGSSGRTAEARAKLALGDQVFSQSSVKSIPKLRSALSKKILALLQLREISSFKREFAELKKLYPLKEESELSAREALADLDLCCIYFARFQYFDEALWCVAQSNQIRPDFADFAGMINASIGLAQMLERSEHYEQAIELCSRLKQLLASTRMGSPSRLKLDCTLAELLLASGEQAKAQDRLQEDITYARKSLKEFKKNPDYANLLLVSARAAVLQGRMQDAAELYKDANQAFTNPSGCNLGLACIQDIRRAAALRNAGKYAESKQLLAEVEKMLGDSSDLQMPDLTMVYIYLSDAFRLSNDYDGSLRVLAAGLDTAIANTEAKKDADAQDVYNIAQQIERLLMHNPTQTSTIRIEQFLRAQLAKKVSGAGKIFLDCLLSKVSRMKNKASIAQQQDQESLKYYYASKLASASALGRLHFSLGEDFLAQGKKPEAKAFFEKSVSSLQNQDQSMLLSFLRLAEFAQEDADLRAALVCLDLARQRVYQYSWQDSVLSLDFLIPIFEQRCKIVEQLKEDKSRAARELDYLSKKQSTAQFLF